MSKKLLRVFTMALMCVMSTTVWAIDKVGGVYQIGSVEDYLAFAKLVNDGDVTASAVMTADIDLGTNGTMIGCDKNRFYGHFDGQGHSITVNSFPSESGKAIFRNVEATALIENLKVQGTITTNSQFAAGIMAWGRGYVRNCYIDLTIKSGRGGDCTHAGIVAVADHGLVVEDCLVKVTINGAQSQNCGGVVGWANENTINVINTLVINDGTLDVSSDCATISRNPGNLKKLNLKDYQDGKRINGATYNNYATKAWKNTDHVTIITPDQLKSGEIAYRLNHDQSRINWVQTIGVDEHPVPAVFAPNSKQVYASGATPCTGVSKDVTYSNTGSVHAEGHDYDHCGVCLTCGYLNMNLMERDPVDGGYTLKTAEDFDRIEVMNNARTSGGMILRMANDIEYTAEPGKFIFWNSNERAFRGSFDGQGHSLTIQMSDMKDENVALFPNMMGPIKNVVLHGSISGQGKFFASFMGHARDMSSLENVASDVNITSTLSGDCTCGGFVGVVENEFKINKAIYAGTLSGNPEATEPSQYSTNNGGLIGWCNARSYLTDVAMVGDVINTYPNGNSLDSYTISRNPTHLNLTNVYCVPLPNVLENAGVIAIARKDVASGKLAFTMNGNKQGGDKFFQAIGVEEFPTPIADPNKKVYAQVAQLNCDGSPKGDVVYGNTEVESVRDEHQYEDGLCSVCGGFQEDFMTPAADGFFEIGNGAQLAWWSHYAAKNLGACARLTADIEMADHSAHYALIGTEEKPFYGSFDGQYHTIRALQIEYPGNKGVGLIACMNSRASKDDGMSDDDARKAEGSYIKNVTLDSDCFILGDGYVGIVGMTAPWAGHVTFQGVGMEGNVTCVRRPDGKYNANAGGVLGCVMYSSCRITLDHCFISGKVGDIEYKDRDANGDLFENDGDKGKGGGNENGSFSGWLGSYAEVTNCYAIGEVAGKESDERYFARFGDATILNCFSKYGKKLEDKDGDKLVHQVTLVNDEDITEGALAWMLNGKGIKNPTWFQNITNGERDYHPVTDPSHEYVIKVGDSYMSFTEETIASVVDALQSYLREFVGDRPAEQALLDDYEEVIETLSGCEDIEALAIGLDAVNEAQDKVQASIDAYIAFKEAIAEVAAYLEEHDDFECALRNDLENYLLSGDEEGWTLGGYVYIIEEHVASAEQLQKEIERVREQLSQAIKEGYVGGTDITDMVVNPNFAEESKGWEGEGNGFATKSLEIKGKTFYGAEVWDATFDRTQTLKGMKPGLYEVRLNGAYRGSNNRYTYNYAANFSVNGTSNYLQTVIEDYIAAADTIDGVNCNLHVDGVTDLTIYADNVSTGDDADAELLGYAVQGQIGMACVVNAGRYLNYVVGEVGEDGILKINIQNPGTKYGSDWTGFGDLRLTYLGTVEDKAATAALDRTLKSQCARIASMMDKYEEQIETYLLDNVAAGPNYPAELKAALQAASDKAQAAASNEEKYAVVKEISDLFKQVYEGKQAYIALNKIGDMLIIAADAMTNMGLINDGTFNEVLDLSFDISEIYAEGRYTLDEVKNPPIMETELVRSLTAPKNADGAYEITTPIHLVHLQALAASGLDAHAKAVLPKDVNMSATEWTPLPSTFSGEFDGQGHTLTMNILGNVNKEVAGSGGIFDVVENGTVKNLILRGTNTASQKFMGTIAADLKGKTVIENCDLSMEMTSYVSGDGTHGGVCGRFETDGVVVKNSLIHNKFMCGEDVVTDSWGGVSGWSNGKSTVEHCLVINDISELSSEEDANMRNNSNTISRNPGNCTITGTYYTDTLAVVAGTLATKEMLKSGEVAFKLNGSQWKEPVWFQTLGQDTIPQLFTGETVYLFGGKYMNEEPNIQMNAYAYKVKPYSNKEEVQVQYTLSADAEAVQVNFYNGETLVYTENLSGRKLTKGEHGAIVPNSSLNVPAGTELTVEVKVTAVGIPEGESYRIGEGYKVYSVYGLACNNNPKSSAFGTLYAVESRADMDAEEYEETICENKPGALFAFDPDFKAINAADGTPGFDGGLTLGNALVISGGDNYKFDLKSVVMSQDGRLFVGRESGTTGSSVWEVDPEDLNKPWTPVFTGGELDAATGITYVGEEEQNRMAAGLAVSGTGADLKLWVLGAARSDGQFHTSDYNCLTYNLGTAKTWNTAPSSNFEGLDGVYTIAPGHVAIAADNNGGLWYKQYRENPSKTEPAIKHFNAEGKEDYSDVSTNSHAAGIAVSPDGSHVVMAMGGNKLAICETNYAPMLDGNIFLDIKSVINTTEDRITAVAIDYANNLYVASSSSKTMNRYAIPSWTDNVTVTPGMNSIKVGTLSDAIENVEAESGIANGAIYNVAGQRVSKAQKGIYIINGKKTAVK